MTHKKFDVPENPMYQPLQVGRKGKEDLGYLGDDTGDEISDQNCYYSELTGLYWIYKNFDQADYVGICHYRRYLIGNDGHTFSEKQYEQLMQEYQIITTKQVELNYSYLDAFSVNHNGAVLEETGKVIGEIYPEYAADFDRLVHQNRTYFGNICVLPINEFKKYAKWLFTIFFEVQKRVDLDAPDEYHRRVFGFISEFLLYVYTVHHQWKALECVVGMTGEKAEIREVKKNMAEFFIKKDSRGAEDYICACLQKRPDILMEASDINGELKLCMQIAATAKLEKEMQGSNILDRMTRYEDLLYYFQGLNRITREKGWEHVKSDKEQYSEIAIEISKRLFQ